MPRISNDYLLQAIQESGRFAVLETGEVFRRLVDGSQKKVGYTIRDNRVQLKVYGRTIYVSRLVWYWFRGHIPEGYEVDHINDDRTDNRLENLQLLTRKQNQAKQHRRHGVPTAKLSAETVQLMRADRLAGMRPKEIARKYEMSESHTRAILRKDFWKDLP